MSSVKESLKNLPTTFQKIIVHTLSNDFDQATKIVTVDFKSFISQLRPNQVVVRYKYVGINASDINFTAGRYDPTIKPPFDAGFEAIGEVVATGKATKIKLLQPVAVMNYGVFAEYQIVSEKALIPIPTLNKAFLSLIVSGLTASLALDYHGHMKSKEVVLVTAAAGGAGQIAVQLAKLAGNHVIGTCSTGKEAFLKSIGCDRVINYKTENVAAVLKKEYPKGVDIVFESVGGEMFQTCMKALNVKGRMIIIGAVSSYANEVKDGEKMNVFSWDSVKTNTLLNKSTTITGFFLNHYVSEFPVTMKKLTDLTLSGKLKPATHDEGFAGLQDVSKAIKCMHAGKNIGKVVVELKTPSAKL
ncbi:Prostaglandin reductase 3 [Boothiomyces macroporosus]|uniref:Prostaglandin reductase 3 n=1 Tax=Boothiomyces macroporosus TaxID=261099 RepID=A0AAD5UP03_9FUNG|nr:Prostaglandin reductase 3 [Boothiomyces macroporosus]KAJ3262371.1 Prostaglandin reductase 3 [Boothiomyces macroporosus]